MGTSALKWYTLWVWYYMEVSLLGVGLEAQICDDR